MFQTMMQAMEQQTRDQLEKGKNARALWFHAWAQENLRAYEPDRKVVYTTAYAFPMEILRAFDVAPFDFELSGAMIGTTEMIVPILKSAEDKGLPRDVCSFHRASLGAHYNELFPKPDLLVTTSFYCDGKGKATEILARRFQAEALLLYVPHELNRDSVRYVEAQLREIVRKLEEVTGRPLDEDRLRQAVRHSNQARRSRQRMLELLKHRPAPWGGRVLVSYAINGQVLAATPLEEEINRTFIQEMEARIDEGGLPEERHRIYWFAWIPTYTSDPFDILRANRASVPLCESFRIFWDEVDEENPYEGLAMKCLKNPFVGASRRRTRDLAAVRDEYGIDGSILFATPACRHSKSAGRLLMEAWAELDVPFLTLDMDICDPRTYAPEQIRTRLEGFMELLDQKRGPRPVS